MGGGFYSSANASTRNATLNYSSVTANSLGTAFKQQAERKAHESMASQNVILREARDSDDHPNTIPVQLYLDVTGSMGGIPASLISGDFIKLMSQLLQRVHKDVCLMFGAIGDHECDNFPLQIGQFEASDELLEMWLTRTYIEKGGGGNTGESYLLAWYFAAWHTKTDSFEKRGQKGIVITIGDEPCLMTLPNKAIQEVMGESAVLSQKGYYTAEELLKLASMENHVFHINLASNAQSKWEQIAPEHVIYVDSQNKVVDAILAKTEQFYKKSGNSNSKMDFKNSAPTKDSSKPSVKPEEIL